MRPWHEHPCFGPFAWLDVRGTETTPEGSGSRINMDEAQVGFPGSGGREREWV